MHKFKKNHIANLKVEYVNIIVIYFSNTCSLLKFTTRRGPFLNLIVLPNGRTDTCLFVLNI